MLSRCSQNGRWNLYKDVETKFSLLYQASQMNGKLRLSIQTHRKLLSVLSRQAASAPTRGGGDQCAGLHRPPPASARAHRPTDDAGHPPTPLETPAGPTIFLLSLQSVPFRQTQRLICQWWSCLVGISVAPGGSKSEESGSRRYITKTSVPVKLSLALQAFDHSSHLSFSIH